MAPESEIVQERPSESDSTADLGVAKFDGSFASGVRPGQPPSLPWYQTREYVTAAEFSTGQVFLNEIVASFVLLFFAYGVGLDPRQVIVFGARLGPILVGLALGLVTFATSGIAPGYGGAQMNPARCFAFGIARQNMSVDLLVRTGNRSDPVQFRVQLGTAAASRSRGEAAA
ncbi:hypothetical protein SAPIO_CDS3737 [Scedosporium apiospermum]|uniref:Aquaporin n=1 Tax=Pseudallescheria apiosperma TaxID=563466 RepID=A0A084G9K6_PSEDA|nr:uncharacterized protein SAPIO_CDS3737 [Scedosporium apiospermum]KEZ44018.1 hypothetical protein SAPIO_CDS3737 [Scedosporium apiospermum]